MSARRMCARYFTTIANAVRADTARTRGSSSDVTGAQTAIDFCAAVIRCRNQVELERGKLLSCASSRVTPRMFSGDSTCRYLGKARGTAKVVWNCRSADAAWGAGFPPQPFDLSGGLGFEIARMAFAETN
jgi:hypothetical protein